MVVNFSQPEMKIKIYIIVLMSVLISACTEPIDIDLNSIPPRLVVDGSITPDTMAHRLLLTRTTDYYNPDLSDIGISGATVYVKEGDNIHYYTESPIQKGLYISDSNFYGVEGNTYTLYISNVDIDNDSVPEEYTAEETMPYIFARLDSVTAFHGPGLPPLFEMYEGTGWNIRLWGQDPPETREFYGFMLTVNDTSYDAYLLEMFRISDDMFNGVYITGLALYFFNDKGIHPLHEGDRILLEGVSITPEFNTYLTMLNNIGGIPLFGGPPSNVTGNISGGALGYFSVYSNRKAKTIL
ncbi:MAG: DUF4249 domain-containing protein [Bacteroidales bacterium]|nr:DUF4249 domain-containing protein [Bacteroidales bacterium]